MDANSKRKRKSFCEIIYKNHFIILPIYGVMPVITNVPTSHPLAMLQDGSPMQ